MVLGMMGAKEAGQGVPSVVRWGIWKGGVRYYMETKEKIRMWLFMLLLGAIYLVLVAAAVKYGRAAAWGNASDPGEDAFVLHALAEAYNEAERAGHAEVREGDLVHVRITCPGTAYDMRDMQLTAGDGEGFSRALVGAQEGQHISWSFPSHDGGCAAGTVKVCLIVRDCVDPDNLTDRDADILMGYYGMEGTGLDGLHANICKMFGKEQEDIK